MKQNKTIGELAEIILEDQSFKNNILNAISEITADGKIDQNDIPIIVKVVLLNYNKFEEFHVKSKQIADLLTYLCIKLLNETDIIKDEDKQNMEKLIKNSIDLVVTSPKIEKTLKKIINKIKSGYKNLLKSCKSCKGKK